MKLLYCDTCSDVFKLARVRRACTCGRVYGKYTDSLKAEVSPTAISLAIGNGSLRTAIAKAYELEKRSGQYLTREDYIEECSILAWARPNKGSGNPHTVEKTDIE